ncbi:MAG: NAD(P)-dependent oxidoreductase [Candidatus Symbiobacter sp.]|nr:NAD(P)-dependent oxidoreductase [Candidatus Symbiobacter sp.]
MTEKNPNLHGQWLDAQKYAENFGDLHPPLTPHQAFVEADRCYYCADAPCQTACPTGIDIPAFIREIMADNPLGAAQTIYNSNILGGACARVCPTETLCEQACVREFAEGKPVKIGALQRYATDVAMDAKYQPFKRTAKTGKRIAVVGGGPAGLACAHGLAVQGHEVTIYESRDKLGGLNEYGIAAYKVPDNFAQTEVDFVLSIGGITTKTGQALGRDVFLPHLLRDYDAVFLAIGLAGVNQLGFAHSDKLGGIEDAVSFIAKLRQAKDLAQVPVGKNVVVVGGGMTAIDAAVQSKLLGAAAVTLVYRRDQDDMKASPYEQELAQTHGVTLRCNAVPVALYGNKDWVTSVECAETESRNGKFLTTDRRFTLAADMVLTAIGQVFVPAPVAAQNDAAKMQLLVGEHGRIVVDDSYHTRVEKLWAGGDCVERGQDLTVAAVEAGKIAAASIHHSFSR